VGEGDLVIGISQSGETLDTLAAMRLARERGAKVLAITNVMGSQATRDSDGVLFTRAGIEIGVAATKTFVAQVATMYLLGLKHAPIALLDERTPVVCIATDAPVLEKVLSNIAEVSVRGAHVVAIATEGTSEDVERAAEEVVYVPRTDWLLQPILAIVPLQLLA